MKTRPPVLWLALLAVTALDGAFAQETNAPPAAPVEPGETGLVVRVQQDVSEAVVSAGNRVDRFLERLLTPRAERRSEFLDRYFGDRSAAEDLGPGTRVRISPGVSYEQDEGLGFTFRFAARVDLPRTRDRLQLVADNLQEDDDVLVGIADRFGRTGRADDDPEENVALRLRAIDRVESGLDLDAGARFRPAPVPRLRIRGKLSPGWETWDVRLYQSVFWYDDEGFGEKTELRTRRELSPDWFVTSSTAALRSQESDGFVLGQTLNLGYVVSPRTAWLLKTGASAETEPEVAMETYSLRLAYERRIRPNWAYVEIEPGADFPRDRDFEFTPQIKVRLKLFFGDV